MLQDNGSFVGSEWNSNIDKNDRCQEPWDGFQLSVSRSVFAINDTVSQLKFKIQRRVPLHQIIVNLIVFVLDLKRLGISLVNSKFAVEDCEF